MTDHDRLLAYLTALVAVFTLAVVVGWLLGPSLGYDEPPTPEHTQHGEATP